MSRQPNLIVVMTDQQRADACAADGFGLDTTPVVDALGRGGVRCTRAFTPTPVCLPARCSALTGRYASGHGQRTNAPPIAPRYDRDLVDVLNGAGYTTALFGKDHTYRQVAALAGCAPPATPYHEHIWDKILRETACVDRELEALRPGFEDWIRELAHGVSAEATPFPADLQQPARVTARAVDWLRARRRQPFYLFLGFDPPHNPYQVPEPYFSLFDPADVPPPAIGAEALADLPFAFRHLRRVQARWVADPEALLARYRANYFGMLRLIDDQVARLLQTLDETGLRDDTVVLVTSDHGDYAGDFGLFRKGAGLPACLTRIPMTWSGPGIEARGDRGGHVSLVDLLPTVCGWLGVDPPAGLQGRDLGPWLRGAEDDAALDSAYIEIGTPQAPLTEADAPPVDGPGYTLGPAEAPTTFSELNPVTMTGHWQSVVTDDGVLVRDPYGGEHVGDLDPAVSPVPGRAVDDGRRQRLRERLDRWQRHLATTDAIDGGDSE